MNKIIIFRILRSIRLFCAILSAGYSINVSAEEAKSVTQYGITWTFDKPCKVGKFVTGDWWVVGPVTVVSVTPPPGPAPADEPVTDGKSRYGAAGLVDDRQLRNGSMIVLGPDANDKWTGFENQGYDSRPRNYKPELTVKFPCKLEVNRSLISTISSERYEIDKSNSKSRGQLLLATPSVAGLYKASFLNPTYLTAGDTAAVLTCLDKEPPADAFRPSYAGKKKTIYQTKDIHWDILPKLKPVPSTPDWAVFERIFQRPWPEHCDSWLWGYAMPAQNYMNYGREYARLTSIAGLMLLLDVPRGQKEKLMVEYIQLGIDLHGVAEMGRQWLGDGAIWQGRKWPILFASLMLDKPELRTFPVINTKRPIAVRMWLEPGPDLPQPSTLFQEDMQTYYGKGAYGQKALWQVVGHSGVQQPYQEKPFSEWTDADRFVNMYYAVTGVSWPGTALAAQLMKAKAIWGHDAFFDCVDRFMRPEELTYDKDDKKTPVPWATATFTKGTTRAEDVFVEEMWKAHRKDVPEQPGAAKNFKWVWIGDNGKGTAGRWVNNPKDADGAASNPTPSTAPAASPTPTPASNQPAADAATQGPVEKNS